MELVALLACALVAALVGAIARRHHKVVAWDRELTAAFGTGTRPEISGRRSL
jgi:hypothetical protein